MDDPTSSTGATTTADSASTRPTLATLPTEMLDRIFWLVDSSDLVNLRMVCKLICAVANRPFAARNFETRRHVVTEDSFIALLAISAHETFGAYIKNIVFSPARALRAVLESDGSENDGIVVDNSLVQSDGFSKLMQRVLSNIKQHSDSVAIGVHEDYCLGHGCHDHLFMSPKRQVFHGERAFCEAAEFGTILETPETLELILIEMHAAAINIDGLSIEFAKHSSYDTKRRTRKAIEKFLGFRSAPIDLRFRWDSNGLLEYQHLQSCLRFSESSLLFNRSYPGADVLLLDYAVQQLADKSLSEINLRDLHVDYLEYLDMYFAQSLRTVILDDINLGSTYFAEDIYSDMFECLSELRDLRYCKLRRLQYILQQERRMSPHVMRTRNGIYRSQWESLLLIFPNGKFEFEVKGTDLSQKLRDLAAYTAAAERHKVQKTETEHKVVDHRVIGAGVPILEQGDPPISFIGIGHLLTWPFDRDRMS